MPRVAADKRTLKAARKAARKMAKILKLVPGAGKTEVYEGLSGYIIVSLHKTPERTKEILEKINHEFEKAVKESGADDVKVVIVPSDKKDWYSF